MLNELYDYRHLKVDSIKNAFLSGKYELKAKDDKRIELLDYIEQQLDKLDTMPKTDLADEYGDDFVPDYLMKDNYDIYLSIKSDYLFSITDFNRYLDNYFYPCEPDDPDEENEPDEEEIEKVRKNYETFIDEDCKKYVEPIKIDCLKLVQLLSAKYDILKYDVYADTHYTYCKEDNYYNHDYYVSFYIYLKCK